MKLRRYLSFVAMRTEPSPRVFKQTSAQLMARTVYIVV